MARQQKRQQKAARKVQIREERRSTPDTDGVPDTEIADIRPGPQPVPAWVRVEPKKS